MSRGALLRAARRAASAALPVAALLAAPTATAQAPYPDPTYLAELVARADALRLHEDPRWLALVHYERRRLLPGFESHASTDGFYLARGGRRDPRAELHATLAGFLEPGARRKDEPLACAFRARFAWLDARLAFDPARLPPPACDAFLAWRREVGGAALSLIFPESFAGSPASMFGHTLFRVDASADESPRNLAAYTLDFTADTGGEEGPLYLLKGLLGFYPGWFGVQPYYEKTVLYADWQNRDIWEYRLGLDAPTLDFLLMHLWELRAVFFPYWFLDENCSYRLLRLLEAARPDLDLSSRFGLVVLPADTVRAVIEEPGLLVRVRYRPSPVTEMRHRLRALSPAAREAARRIGLGELAPDDPTLDALDARERAAALTIAYDYLHWRFVRGEVPEEESRALALGILRARSRLGRAPGGEPLFAPVPMPELRPDEGHRSARASLGGGVRNGEGYVEARARFALHDLVDPRGGYPRDSQVDVLDTRLRVYPGPGRVRLEELVLLDVRTQPVRDDFFAPLSWRFDVGMRTRLFDASGRGMGDPHPVGRLSGGLGGTWELPAGAQGYALAEATLDGGPALEHDVAFGPGAALGLYAGTPGDRWRGHLFARLRSYVAGDRTLALAVGSEQRLSLGRRLALRLALDWNRDFGHGWLESQLALQLYF